jgi:hypothetical protein
MTPPPGTPSHCDACESARPLVAVVERVFPASPALWLCRECIRHIYGLSVSPTAERLEIGHF